MSNKLTFDQAVRSGKNFRCVETGLKFFRDHENTISRFRLHSISGTELTFNTEWLDQTFEIIEVKKELTASEIEAAFEYAWEHSNHADIMKQIFLKELGF